MECTSYPYLSTIVDLFTVEDMKAVVENYVETDVETRLKITQSLHGPLKYDPRRLATQAVDVGKEWVESLKKCEMFRAYDKKGQERLMYQFTGTVCQCAVDAIMSIIGSEGTAPSGLLSVYTNRALWVISSIRMRKNQLPSLVTYFCEALLCVVNFSPDLMRTFRDNCVAIMDYNDRFGSNKYWEKRFPTAFPPSEGVLVTMENDSDHPLSDGDEISPGFPSPCGLPSSLLAALPAGTLGDEGVPVPGSASLPVCAVVFAGEVTRPLASHAPLVSDASAVTPLLQYDLNLPTVVLHDTVSIGPAVVGGEPNNNSAVLSMPAFPATAAPICVSSGSSYSAIPAVIDTVTAATVSSGGGDDGPPSTFPISQAHTSAAPHTVTFNAATPGDSASITEEAEDNDIFSEGSFDYLLQNLSPLPADDLYDFDSSATTNVGDSTSDRTASPGTKRARAEKSQEEEEKEVTEEMTEMEVETEWLLLPCIKRLKREIGIIVDEKERLIDEKVSEAVEDILSNVEHNSVVVSLFRTQSDNNSLVGAVAPAKEQLALRIKEELVKVEKK
jgi:hypothetical protein